MSDFGFMSYMAHRIIGWDVAIRYSENEPWQYSWHWTKRGATRFLNTATESWIAGLAYSEQAKSLT